MNLLSLLQHNQQKNQKQKNEKHGRQTMQRGAAEVNPEA